VGVDEAWRHHLTGRVDRLSGGGRREVADRADAAVADPDVGLIWLGTGAIDDQPASDEKLRQRTAARRTRMTPRRLLLEREEERGDALLAAHSRSLQQVHLIGRLHRAPALLVRGEVAAAL
jgi:hypothetical protein